MAKEDDGATVVETLSEKSPREKSDDFGTFFALAGLAVGLMGLMLGGKKAARLLKGEDIKTSCKISPEGGCRFYVRVSVKPECISNFINATKANQFGARKESGNFKYEIYQKKMNMTEFVLYEIYRSEKAERDHRKSFHYKEWKRRVKPMMAKPREKYYTGGIPYGYELIS